VREHPWPDAEVVRQAGHRAGHSDTDLFHAQRWAGVEVVPTDDGSARLVPGADLASQLSPGRSYWVTVLGLLCECCSGDGERYALVEHDDAANTLAFVQLPPEADDIVQPGARCYLALVEDEQEQP
jgi:hypothetical protein